MILAELTAGGRRYQDLQDGLGAISHKVLTDTLRRAERDGLIMRHLDAGPGLARSWCRRAPERYAVLVVGRC